MNEKEKEKFLNYYSNELNFIRQMGAEFAALHPQIAGKLELEATQCADPHVERLLEGFAFLTARVRKKIDDEYPEITNAFLSVVYPHYLRPIPSMAIAQFLPSADATKMTTGHVVPRGVELTSPPVSGGAPCRFRSAYPVALWPVVVESVSMAPDRVAIAGKPTGSVGLLRLGLRCTSPGDWNSLEGFESLRFHLHGGEPVPTTLYESLFNDISEVWVRGRIKDGAEKTVVLPHDSIEPVGFAADEALLPYPDRSFPGYRLLQEYFAFPPKFLFFNLKNLDLIRTAKFEGPVEILFFLKHSPRIEVPIRPDNIRLGCSPIVNLFEIGGEPFRLTRLKTSYPIVPKYDGQGGFEIYSVDKVASTGGGFLERGTEFQPFYSKRASLPGAKQTAYWYESRRLSIKDGEEVIEVELSFTDPNFSALSPSVQAISTHLTCTNRDIPSHLQFGGNSGDFQLLSDAPVGQVRLLTQPTKTYRPPLGRSAQWAMITHLGANHLSLIESDRGGEPLRRLLTVYDFVQSAVTTKMINGIINVTSERVPGRTGNRLGNTLSLGMKVSVQFDEDFYAGSGAFLTASVLERFLGAYVTINSFTQMVATSKQREGIWKRWPPRCGDRTLL